MWKCKGFAICILVTPVCPELKIAPVPIQPATGKSSVRLVHGNKFFLHSAQVHAFFARANVSPLDGAKRQLHESFDIRHALRFKFITYYLLRLSDHSLLVTSGLACAWRCFFSQKHIEKTAKIWDCEPSLLFPFISSATGQFIKYANFFFFFVYFNVVIQKSDLLSCLVIAKSTGRAQDTRCRRPQIDL